MAAARSLERAKEGGQIPAPNLCTMSCSLLREVRAGHLRAEGEGLGLEDGGRGEEEEEEEEDGRGGSGIEHEQAAAQHPCSHCVVSGVRKRNREG
eukprot:759503-Hanusia_phi.AAC.3